MAVEINRLIKEQLENLRQGHPDEKLLQGLLQVTSAYIEGKEKGTIYTSPDASVQPVSEADPHERNVTWNKYDNVSIRPYVPGCLKQSHEIDQLGLKPRSRNSLVGAGFQTLDDIRFGFEHDLLGKVKGFGKAAMRDINSKFPPRSQE